MRSLKPSNVIVSWASDAVREGARPRCDVTVIDFDISRVRREGSGADTVRFGTPAFAPPEQFGLAQTDSRSDIYALGILANKLVTGEHPSVKLCTKGKLGRFIVKATNISPEKRFDSAEDVLSHFR